VPSDAAIRVGSGSYDMAWTISNQEMSQTASLPSTTVVD
jgi:hypothetical protein